MLQSVKHRPEVRSGAAQTEVARCGLSVEPPRQQNRCHRRILMRPSPSSGLGRIRLLILVYVRALRGPVREDSWATLRMSGLLFRPRLVHLMRTAIGMRHARCRRRLRQHGDVVDAVRGRLRVPRLDRSAERPPAARRALGGAAGPAPLGRVPAPRHPVDAAGLLRGAPRAGVAAGRGAARRQSTSEVCLLNIFSVWRRLAHAFERRVWRSALCAR